MRFGKVQDAASLLLLLLGATFVLAVALNPLVTTHWTVPTDAIYLADGVTLWQAGRLVRHGKAYGYPLAAAIVLIVPSTVSL